MTRSESSSSPSISKIAAVNTDCLATFAVTARDDTPADGVATRASILEVSQPRHGLIALEHGCNFRQVSDHVGHGGRRLRAGRLFRSGVLAYFSELDHEQLSAYGIRTIVDLRRADERRREPTRWCSPEVITLSADDETTPASLLRFALRTAQTQANMRQAMIAVYCAMPDSLADRLRALFESLRRGETPMLVHCAAGKDRTGFAIAVILEALGVSRATVLEDYLYTNHAVDLERFVLAHHPGSTRHPEARHPLKQLAPDVRAALLGADADYLNAALAAIEQTYGCVESYLERRLGVDWRALARVRDALLE
jgi:protein-tyrosine phosphatase